MKRQSKASYSNAQRPGKNLSRDKRSASSQKKTISPQTLTSVSIKKSHTSLKGINSDCLNTRKTSAAANQPIKGGIFGMHETQTQSSNNLITPQVAKQGKIDGQEWQMVSENTATKANLKHNESNESLTGNLSSNNKQLSNHGVHFSKTHLYQKKEESTKVQTPAQVFAFTKVFVMGETKEGQLGFVLDQETDPMKQHRASILEVPKVCSYNILIRQIACGETHTHLLSQDGYVYSMGNNSEGVLGLGQDFQSLKSITQPQLISNLSGVVMIATGRTHSLALNSNREVYGWGRSDSGAIGHKILPSQQNRPMKIDLETMPHDQVVQIGCGLEYSSFLTAEGMLFSCGEGEFGQLGLGYDVLKEFKPQQVLFRQLEPGDYFIKVACGAYHQCFLTRYKKVYSTGSNLFGQLGLGTKLQQVNQPMLIKDLDGKQIVDISCGESSFAITQTGEMWVWGLYNYQSHNVPFNPPTLNRPLAQISQSFYGVSAAVDIDGKAWLWDSQSQTSSNVLQLKAYPQIVRQMRRKQVKRIFAGNNLFFALTEDVFPDLQSNQQQPQTQNEISELQEIPEREERRNDKRSIVHMPELNLSKLNRSASAKGSNFKQKQKVHRSSSKKLNTKNSNILARSSKSASKKSLKSFSNKSLLKTQSKSQLSKSFTHSRSQSKSRSKSKSFNGRIKTLSRSKKSLQDHSAKINNSCIIPTKSQKMHKLRQNSISNLNTSCNVLPKKSNLSFVKRHKRSKSPDAALKNVLPRNSNQNSSQNLNKRGMQNSNKSQKRRIAIKEKQANKKFKLLEKNLRNDQLRLSQGIAIINQKPSKKQGKLKDESQMIPSEVEESDLDQVQTRNQLKSKANGSQISYPPDGQSQTQFNILTGDDKPTSLNAAVVDEDEETKSLNEDINETQVQRDAYGHSSPPVVHHLQHYAASHAQTRPYHNIGGHQYSSYMGEPYSHPLRQSTANPTSSGNNQYHGTTLQPVRVDSLGRRDDTLSENETLDQRLIIQLRTQIQFLEQDNRRLSLEQQRDANRAKELQSMYDEIKSRRTLDDTNQEGTIRSLEAQIRTIRLEKSDIQIRLQIAEKRARELEDKMLSMQAQKNKESDYLRQLGKSHEQLRLEKNKLRDLNNQVEILNRTSRVLEQTIEQVKQDRERLEQENAKLKTIIQQQKINVDLYDYKQFIQKMNNTLGGDQSMQNFEEKQNEAKENVKRIEEKMERRHLLMSRSASLCNKMLKKSTNDSRSRSRKSSIANTNKNKSYNGDIQIVENKQNDNYAKRSQSVKTTKDALLDVKLLDQKDQQTSVKQINKIENHKLSSENEFETLHQIPNYTKDLSQNKKSNDDYIEEVDLSQHDDERRQLLRHYKTRSQERKENIARILDESNKIEADRKRRQSNSPLRQKSNSPSRHSQKRDLKGNMIEPYIAPSSKQMTEESRSIEHFKNMHKKSGDGYSPKVTDYKKSQKSHSPLRSKNLQNRGEKHFDQHSRSFVSGNSPSTMYKNGSFDKGHDSMLSQHFKNEKLQQKMHHNWTNKPIKEENEDEDRLNVYPVRQFMPNNSEVCPNRNGAMTAHSQNIPNYPIFSHDNPRSLNTSMNFRNQDDFSNDAHDAYRPSQWQNKQISKNKGSIAMSSYDKQQKEDEYSRKLMDNLDKLTNKRLASNASRSDREGSAGRALSSGSHNQAEKISEADLIRSRLRAPSVL